MKETFYGHLDRLIDEKLPYAIWGAGITGNRVSCMAKDYNDSLHEEFFIDNNPALWGKKNTVSPAQFFGGLMREIDTVFVGVYVADEVVLQLKEEGYRGVIVPISPSAMRNTGYQELFIKNSRELIELKDMLADQRSADTLDVLQTVVETGDIGLWERVNDKSINKLLCPEILKYNKDEALVEIGAFIGDTTEQFVLLCNGNYKSVVGLEPDPENYKVLCESYKKLKNAVPINGAAGEMTGKVRFAANMSEGGYVTENGNVEVPSFRLDDLDLVQDASFIKVSTNGFELSALKGAEEIIKKNKPKLSYYCGKEQLWKIPQYLKSIVPEYKLYIRHYGIGTTGMIGYGVVDD